MSLTPRPTTVQALTSLPAPPFRSSSSRQAPVELSTYRVSARLVAMAFQIDGDLKLIVSDPRTGVTMAAELPAAACALRAPARLRAMMRTARAAVEQACGIPNATQHYTFLQGEATITGVGFFDSIHGQQGVAPNGIELHPVLDFASIDCGSQAPATLQVTVKGSGIVSSSFGGLACPPTCSGSFPSGTQVELVAAPAPRTSFVGWTGPCSPTRSPVCRLAVDGDVSVIARFSRAHG